jgi:hypothetical protein
MMNNEIRITGQSIGLGRWESERHFLKQSISKE